MPNLAPLFAAEPLVQVHVMAACLSILLAPLIIFRSRRDRLHKMGGYVWVTSMAITALSSFGISGIGLIGPFSPIHLLSIFTLVGLFTGVRLAIRRNIAAHQDAMRSLAFWALGVAGTLAFMPGRLMNRMLFPEQPDVGFFYVLVTVASLGALAHYLKLRPRVN